ncbi:MAG: wax ester/triacylglycerol synthase domain-containing protein, partial [Acidimicrobiales bacterium]
MQQLTGLDAAFLYMETASNFGHVSGLAIFDPASAGAVTLEDVKELLESRMHLLPPLRRRLVEVPFGLDHPYWIEDPDFDLDFHVREVALPKPGNRQQLAEQVARIVSRPLDRNHPLWELYVISGLDNGHVAQLTKIHHSSIDGVSGAEVLATILDIEPEPKPVEPPAQPWRPDPRPDQLELLARGVAALVTTPAKSISFQRRAL